ncbi:MAG: nicotinamidase [Actinomycetota bacterium]|nr:nicotinamidase [Actinomycetota bacterium]
MAEALLVIDFQNDFTPPDGALAVPEGDEIAGRVNELAASDRFDLVVATRDWHPPDHSQFEEQGGPWPTHCVQGTEGAELHPSLDRDTIDVVVDKGQDPDEDGYSGFEDTDLAKILREHGIDTVTIVGLAADVCVKNTALDAARQGFRVVVDREGTRGVDVEPGDTDRAFEEMQSAGATVA